MSCYNELITKMTQKCKDCYSCGGQAQENFTLPEDHLEAIPDSLEH